MHPSAYRIAQDFAECLPADARVLDVGSLDVNGSLRPLFGDYTGIDRQAGPNVDVVWDGERMPFGDGEFDAVVSSSCLEHDPAFWQTFTEMCRVSREWVYCCVPSVQRYHAHPVDCWRFMDDAWPALCEWATRQGHPTQVELSGSSQGEPASIRDCWAVMVRRVPLGS